MDLSASLFQQLRPSCVLLAKDPSVKALQNIQTVIDALDDKCLLDRTLLDYVLFPLKLTLQKEKNLNEEEIILCYNTISLIIKKTSSNVLSEDLIIWNFNIFSLFFGNPEKGNTNSSEEMKCSLVEMICCMCKNTTQEHFSTIFKEDYLPLIGHIISIFIDCIVKEKNGVLQLNSLKCLYYICGCNISSEQLQWKIGNFLSSFLPGIAMMFNRTFQSNLHQNHKLVISSLNVFAQILSITLNDSHFVIDHFADNNLEDILVKSKFLESDQKHENGKSDEKQLCVERNKEWLQKTSDNLLVVFKNMLPILMMHDNIKVRVKLNEFVKIIMSHCFESLSNVMPECLDCLVKLSCDQFDEVKLESEKILILLNKKFQAKGYVKLKSMLDEKLYSEFLSLPRIMNNVNDDIKLAKVQIIKGYLQFYGKRLSNILNSFVHLEKYMCSLLQILELDPVNIKMVEEKTAFQNTLQIGSSNDQQHNYLQNKHFKLFTNTKILIVIQDIIGYLASCGDVQLLLDFLLEQCKQNPVYKAPAVLIINEIVAHLKDQKDFDTMSIIEMLVSTYLEDDFWRLPVSNQHLSFITNEHSMLLTETEHSSVTTSSMFNKVISYETLHNNIQIICLLLEGISQFAKCLKTNFNLILMQILYPVLEKIGSTNAAISHAAIACLNDITHYCNYQDAGDLILMNSDYLLNSITMQFRHLVFGSAAPSVLSVVLKFCDKDLLPLISDAIDDVFRALDDYQDDVAEEMLTVLKWLAVAVNKWNNKAVSTDKLKSEEKIDTKKKTKDLDDLSIFNNDMPVSNFFTSCCQLYKDASGDIDESEINDEETLQYDSNDQTGESVDEKKEETPLQFKVIVSALDKCVCFIASSNDQIKLKALDVAYNAVEALQKRENDLLPALHKIWPSIINRLKDKNQAVVIRTLDTICMMVEHSGDFLRKRMSTEFLTHAIEFLQEHSKMFTKDTSKYLQIHKIQERLIRYLGDIIPTLEVSMELFCKVASVCAQYFDCRLHYYIQEASFYSMRKFYEYKPDVIWMLLQTSYNTTILNTPHHYFSNIILSEESKKRNVYTDNVIKFIDKEKIYFES